MGVRMGVRLVGAAPRPAAAETPTVDVEARAAAAIAGILSRRGRWQHLHGEEAAAYHELVIDVNEWLDTNVTGRTKEIMDEAYDNVLAPMQPVICHLPSGRTMPYGPPGIMSGASAWMQTESGIRTGKALRGGKG